MEEALQIVSTCHARLKSHQWLLLLSNSEIDVYCHNRNEREMMGERFNEITGRIMYWFGEEITFSWKGGAE